MSYILDALKRADTERERERGNVPDLYSLNLPSGSFPRVRQRQSRKLPRDTVWAGLLVLAGWSIWLSVERQQDAASTSGMTPYLDTRLPVETVTAPVASPEPLTARASDLPILAPPPPPERTERPQKSDRAGATAADKSSTATATATATEPVPATAQPASRGEAPHPATTVRRFAELSHEHRAQLPQVNVSGSTYSSNPKLRTLIANGRMIQEGEEIAPGLQLETIDQRSAVLNFHGTRYSIAF